MRDTIDMAREVKMPYDFVTGEPIYIEKLKAFEALVRADEREACAKVCEEYETNNDITATWLNIVAEAIRARSKNEDRN
jgi:hypothetical protein